MFHQLLHVIYLYCCTHVPTEEFLLVYEDNVTLYVIAVAAVAAVAVCLEVHVIFQ